MEPCSFAWRTLSERTLFGQNVLKVSTLEDKKKLFKCFTCDSKFSNPKGQLISKCLFGVIVWTKNQRKNYQNFCPIEAKTEILVIFSLVFCPNDDTKKTF